MISCFLHHRYFRSRIDNRHQIQTMDLHWHFDGNCIGLETTQNNWSSCLFLAVEHDVLVITWSPTGFLALNCPQALTGRCNDSLGVHLSSFRTHPQTALCRGNKPLSERMMVSLPTHIVTQPQWVNEFFWLVCYCSMWLSFSHRTYVVINSKHAELF